MKEKLLAICSFLRDLAIRVLATLVCDWIRKDVM